MTADDIRTCLLALAPTQLHVEDQSAAHAHHKHNPDKSGGTHFAVRIESAQFAGLSALARHRLVYAALGDAFNQAKSGGTLHALAIEASAPGE